MSELDSLIADTLRRTWGFDTLRPLQREVVEACLNHRDAVVVMPTGGGKSLCFQLPPLLTGDLTVVVSPLIALMKDQVDGLKTVGIPAAALNSSLTAAEIEEARSSVLNGHLKLLYISPERLAMDSTISLLRSANQGKGVARFAIDEAHCISAWGHDFRPEYRQLDRLKANFPGACIQAFTATATPKVQKDIAIQLRLERPRLFVGGFDRPNLTYRVVAKSDAGRLIVDAAKRHQEEGVIVYCLSRKDTESTAETLTANGVPAVAYHAGLSPQARKKISEDFAQERVNVVAATIAFGMGIDRSNVRCVIHECLPRSIEGYQQETGRAGRDGLPSECILLYRPGDVTRLRKLLGDGPPAVVEHNYRLLEEVRRFATSPDCRHKALSEYFGQSYELPEEGCGACDVCLGGTRVLQGGSEIAHTILRAVSILPRPVGAATLAAMLAGRERSTVRQMGTSDSEAFGLLSSFRKTRIQPWIQQLADQGYLSQSTGKFPVVTLTERGAEALEAGESIRIVENVAIANVRESKRSQSEVEVAPADRALFEKLRAWRKATAEERSVPPYVILHDATLMRIATIRPQTLSALGRISGLGERRVADLGPGIIELVKSYLNETGEEGDQALPTGIVTSPPPLPKPTSSTPFFDRGLTLEEVVQERGITPATAAAHLEEWIRHRKPTSIATWVSDEELEKGRAAFEKHGFDYLKPAFEEHGGTIPYDRLRAIRAYLQTQKS